MKTFDLNMYEMQAILDEIHQDAYDKLQSALEAKICKVMTEGEWLSIWESGDWDIQMTINLKNDVKEAV